MLALVSLGNMVCSSLFSLFWQKEFNMEGLALTPSFKIQSIIMKFACNQEHEAAGNCFPGHKVETCE